MWFSLETIVSRAKRRGFAYPGSDIYGWLANARDLGPYGTEIKRNIEGCRWKYFVQEREDIIWLDSQILMNPKVREASGHVWGFSDPLVDCKKCKSRYRADQLIEEYIAKNKLDLKKVQEKITAENLTIGSWTFEQQFAFLQEFKVKCPKCW